MKLNFSYEMRLGRTFVSHIVGLEFNGPVGKIEMIPMWEEVYIDDDEWHWENNSIDVDILINGKQADSIDEVKAAMTGAQLVPKEGGFNWLYWTEKWSDRAIVEDLSNVVDKSIKLTALTIEDGEESWDIPKETFEGIWFGSCSDMIENYENSPYLEDDDYYDEDDDDEDDEDDDDEDDEDDAEELSIEYIASQLKELEYTQKLLEKSMVPFSDEKVIKLTDDNVEGWADRVFGPDYDEEEGDRGFTWSNYSELPDNVILDTSELTDFSGLFELWTSLKVAPDLDTSNGRKFDRMFANCYQLNYVPQYDLSNATTAKEMFEECGNLRYIPDMNINPSACTENMFLFSGIDADENSEFLNRCKAEQEVPQEQQSEQQNEELSDEDIDGRL